jgi:putative ATPase
MTEDLFGATTPSAPLAARLRPQSLDDYVGQAHLIGPGKPLSEALRSGQLPAMVLWGPPGVGKTTLARLLARHSGALFLQLSAVLSGVKDIRDAVISAKQAAARGEQTVLFVDEVHRFNKSQQDAFLPHVEDGTLRFIGATTENPAFELNSALLSRVTVYRLRSLELEDLSRILERALASLAQPLPLNEVQRSSLLKAAQGDARKLLNVIEWLDQAHQRGSELTDAAIEQALQGNLRRFDKRGEVFYEQISALHKAVRGNAPDAALYWFARMLDGGCDPLYVARRLVRMASEDIGNADPRALSLALDAWQVQERLGSPEGELGLAQAVVYLACAPKSNAVYTAFAAARHDVSSAGDLPVPLHLRNAPTRIQREEEYGAGYRYAHDEPQGHAAGENYFPPELAAQRYYLPVDRGLEQRIAQRLEGLRELDENSTMQRYPRSPERR